MTDSAVNLARPTYLEQGASALVENPYVGARNMAARKPADVISWDSFKWVVSGLLGLICILVTGAFIWMRDDLGDIKKDIRDINKEIANSRLELTKAVGLVAVQAQGTNSRLDQLIADGRQRSR